MKAKPLLQGAGLATLYILPIAGRFLDPRLNEVYHHQHPISSVPLAMFAMTLLVGIVTWITFFAIEHLPEMRRNLASIALAVLFVVLLIRVLMFLRQPSFKLELALGVLYCLLVLVPVVLLVSLRMWKGFFARCTAAIGFLYRIAGFGLLVILPRLAGYSFRSGPPEQTSFRHDGLPTQQANARIVWILMDELSYDQTFDHRQPDLSLPNFDSFAKQSVSFSNLKPSGFYTEVIVPGLLLGEPIQELKTPVRGQVSFRDVAGGAWHPLDQQRSIFAEAWKLGWNPGVAGWYNPYCRLFPDVLARCSWQYSDRPPAIEVPLSYDKSVTENMRALMPIRSDFKFIFRHPLDNSTHGRDYADVMKQAEDLLQDQRIRFVFLHLPVPHPPGIYDRSTHRMSSHGSYLDNLVLADDTLGTLIKTLRSMHSYEQTAVIVSSDHSWRTQLWKADPDWSNEDERVSHGGKFDPRPVLMVHLPGAITGQVIAQPVNEMIVHRILDSLLRGKLQRAADLNQVVNPRPQEPAPVLKQSLVNAAPVAISVGGD